MGRVRLPASSMPSELPIASLFDVDVAAAQSRIEGAAVRLYPDEVRYIAAAVPKRQAEFGVARMCARQALAELGIAPQSLVPHSDRSPRWPAGIAGSITHAGDFCAVVATTSPPARGVGLDAENDRPLERALEERIATQAEIGWLRAHDDDERGWLGMLLFCAKEAFYKCQYPLTQTFLDFHDVELRVDLPAGRFVVTRIARHGSGWRSVADVRGRWLRAGGLIVAGATL